MSSEQDQQLDSLNENGNAASQRIATDAAIISFEQFQSSTQAHAATGSATITIADTPSPSVNHELLTLSLQARPNVKWDDSVIDNEGQGRKSSKRCCIFQKPRAYDESSTDTSDYDSDRSLSSGGGSVGSGDGKKMPAKKPQQRKIARPKQGKKAPDYQRYHA